MPDGDAQTISPYGTKMCSKCGNAKSLSEFAKASRERSGYQSACKACRKNAYGKQAAERRKQRYASDPLFRDRQKAFVSAAFKKYGQKYKQQQLDRYRSNQDVRWAAVKRVVAWRESNPDGVRVHCSSKRAREAGAFGSFSAADVKRILASQSSRCIYCGSDISGGLHTVEHLTPLSRGGTNKVENIALACRSCNARKGDKMVTEFLSY